MENQLYHILNRGVEKRKIFLSKQDYLRFVHNMNDFNHTDITILSYQNRRLYSEVSAPKENMKLIGMLCWALIPNHFHFMVNECTEKGASIFTQKMTGGYTMYFNPRHERSGTLFQGRTKIIPVLQESHFIHLPFYILANPLDLYQVNWKEDGVKDPKTAFDFLVEYPWSSLGALMGKNNFSETIKKNLFFELFDTNEKIFRKDFIEWLAGNDFDEEENFFSEVSAPKNKEKGQLKLAKKLLRVNLANYRNVVSLVTQPPVPLLLQSFQKDYPRYKDLDYAVMAQNFVRFALPKQRVFL